MEIANAIRDQKPEVIVVDDAHADPERLARLVGMRRRIGEKFSIVATTWRGQRDDVVAALNVPEVRIHTLEPLPRQQIQQVFEELGVKAQDEDLRELVDQASNKPGLATTLAAFWLEGDWLSVLRGRTLARDTLRSVRRLVGRHEEALLATLSLGGRCGMQAKQVGEKLGMGALETRERLASLTAAGVLSDVMGDDYLVVQPRALRSVLLASVFFPHKEPRLRYRDYLDLAPGYDSTVCEIVTAAAWGARISTVEMQRLLEGLDPAEYPLRKEAQRAWGTFVGLGRQEALWAFENYPGGLVDIAWPGLRSAAEATIQRLLEEAEEARRQVSSEAHFPLRLLGDWLYEITSPVEDTLERRRRAIQAARGYAEAADSADALAVAFRLGCMALRPTVQSATIDPTRTGLITRRGPLPPAQLRQMKGVWEDAVRLFKITGVVSFPELFSELEEWLRLADTRRKAGEDEERFSLQFVVEMMRDLTPLAAGRIGLTVALVRLAGELDVELPLDPDPRFEALFPPLSESLTSESEPLEALVGEWADTSPAEVVETLLHLIREAKSIPLGYYSKVSDVCRMLAVRTRQPEPWFEALTERKAPSTWLAPFLDQLSTLPSFGDRVGRCLHDEAYTEIGIRSVLRLPDPSPDLLKAALERAVDFPSVARGMGLRGELSTAVAKTVLAHPDPALGLAMAFGEWMADPKGKVRPELGEHWRQAVLDSIELKSPNRLGSYQLRELLGADQELAYEWLLRLGASTSGPDSEIRSAAGSVLEFLGPGRRLDLLERLSAGSVLMDFLPKLIAHDGELYRRLLDRKALADFHLLPLRGLPGADWADLAKIALGEGFGPEKVALAAYSGHHTLRVWPGNVEKHWQRWDEAFASLDPPADSDPGWQEIIHHGREYARRKIREAEQESRHIERDGMFMLADPG